MGWPRATAPAWPVHVLLLVCAAAGLIAYELAGHAGRPVVQTVIAASPVLTWALAIASGHLGHRRPWLIAVGGIALLLAAQIVWPGYVRDGHLGAAEFGPADLTLSAAHGLFLAGTAMALWRRMSEDAGGIVDAALLGLCAGGPMWVWLIEPNLSPQVTNAGQVLILVDVLVLCGVLGCFARMATVPGPARAPMLALLSSCVLTLFAIGAGVTTAGQENRWSAAFWMLAFLALAVAPLLPGAYAVTASTCSAAPATGAARLGWLTAALSTNPLLAAVQILRGSDSANLLLAIGTLMVIPLVVLRIRWLTGQRERAERTLAHQASHDELTGLRNRRHIMGEIDAALAELHRGDLAGITLLLCDLDGFKPINDRYGHLVGDQALQSVAARLTAVTAPGDTVARLGGDEFLVLRRDGSAGDLAERIGDALREPMDLSAGPVTVGVTIGTAGARSGEPADRETLIGRADADMYTGKAAHRPKATQPA
ncbi:diguanylate cyclase domain-containing protein [Actinoplanes sp. GCM10030250]|uniref:diguanylate cyclase domain-containing protein n=1 Tax=Actinoplanes sp. GCM10030250 TaxID=3273376 RepID=UPI003618F96F